VNDRHTKADEPDLIYDELARAEREAANAVNQFDMVLDLIDEVARSGRPFRLRVSTILKLHETALAGIDRRAGAFRQGPVEIEKSAHKPPQAHLVGSLVEEMCDWVNDNFSKATALHLCAYVMWRLNWIHPFTDGNGRTSRAVAYLVLCARLGDRLPGRNTVPEQIAANRAPYYQALEAADAAWTDERLDLSSLEELLKSQLAIQLEDAWKAAQTADGGAPATRKFH
jgi:Fic family protein